MSREGVSKMEIAYKPNPALSSKHEFRRRLNRDPDKGFDYLSTDGKVLVTSLRTALEEAKHRIVRLRDENDAKDDIIEEERNCRIALEEKMEKYLVDLYQNPDVNDELHQRLPRAKKKDPLFQRADDEHHNVTGFDSEHDAASESSDVEVKDNTDHNLSRKYEPASQLRKVPNVNLQPDNQVTQTEDTSQGLQNTPGNLSNNQSSSAPNTNVVFNQPAFVGPSYHPGIHAFPGNPTYQQPYYTPMYHQQIQPNQLASSSMTSIASSSYMGLPPPIANQGGLQDTNPPKHNPIAASKPPNLNPDVHSNIQATPQAALANSATNPYLQTLGNPPSAGVINLEEGQGYQQVSSVPRLDLTQLPSMQMPVPGSGFVTSQFDRMDNVSHLTRLLQENSVLKTENKELKTELKQNKRDLELLKINAGDDEDKMNTTDVIHAMIEEVKRSEKQSERAISQLIQSANEDRNAALQDMDNIRLKASKRNLTLSSISQTDGSCIEDTEENDLVDSTLASDSEILISDNEELRLTSLRMEKLLERQREISKQEISAMTAQRDDALDKVNRLRKKLASAKLSEFPNATNQKLQAKLKITEKERDIAVGKLKMLSHDMKEVTLMYNLQKVLMTDDVNIHSNDPASSKWTHTENNEKHVKTPEDMEIEDEKGESKLEAKLKSLGKENVEKDKRIEKLEALVLRQRKKLNTLCAGPLLMEN